ncbi:hypothetical protein [Actinomyces naeslundii]|uniref:hypothetical protein n=1 Tax=Actinomyces naeslundii TaxID=1655 RepID=UPI0009D6F42B|nr:hypothetical protein [Actinomyces naeslundii]
MTGMILGGEITSALTTFAGLGLALILEGDGAERVRLGWTDAAEPRMVVTADGYDDEAIAGAVYRHATACLAPSSWIGCDLQAEPWKGRNAVFSPRVKAPKFMKQWQSLQAKRIQGTDHEMEDATAPGYDIDLEFIGALGEPAYWYFTSNGSEPDGGASRWEMKTRNQGQDFVRNRLRQLNRIVAARDVVAIVSGLTGRTVEDEAYKGKRSDESRTATGLTSPRFTDSVLAWCALWGISSFPVIHRIKRVSVTAGAVPIGRFNPTHLVLPVLVGPRTLERWRVMVVSEQIIRAVTNTGDVAAGVPERAWLMAHGVRAILTFRFYVSDNSKAPERSLGAGMLEVMT